MHFLFLNPSISYSCDPLAPIWTVSSYDDAAILHQACLLPSFYGGAWKPQSFYSLHSGRSPDLWGTSLRPDQEGPEVKKPLKFSLRLLFFHSLLKLFLFQNHM